MSPYKEPNVLANPKKNLTDYARLFAPAGDEKYLGESSTSYLTLPAAIARIGKLSPPPRLIIMVRNPVDRAWSHYWFARGKFGVERRPFRKAFAADLEAEPVFAVHTRNYYQAGAYAKWLHMFLRAVPPDHIHTVVFEDFVADTEDVMQGVFAFLGVPYEPPRATSFRNEGGVVSHPLILRSWVAVSHAAGKTIGRLLPATFYNALVDANHQALTSAATRLRKGGAPRLSPADREWVASFYQRDVEDLERTLHRTFPWPDFAK